MNNNSNRYNEIMSRFDELSTQYKNFSEGIYSKDETNFDNGLLNYNSTDVTDIISKMNSDMTKIQESINELKIEYDKYVQFEKLCCEYIDSYNKQKVLINNISDNMIIVSLDFDRSLLNEENKVHSNILKLQNKAKSKMDELSNKINLKKSKIDNFKKLIFNSVDETVAKKMTDDYLCQICFTNKITTCLTPCGHTFCIKCSEKMIDCANCRSRVEKKIKMFIDHKNDEIVEIKSIQEINSSENNNIGGGVVGNSIVTGFLGSIFANV